MGVPAGMRGRKGPARASASEQRVNTLELYRGRARLALIRDLAMGEWSHRELAQQMGVTQTEVATFAAMHAMEVSEVRSALAGELAIETAGLWVSKRQNRVAELQSDIESLEEDIAAARNVFGPGSKEHVNLLRTRLIALKQVADEYHPARLEKESSGDAPNMVHYVIESDDEITQALT